MNNLLDGIRRFKLARQMARKPAEAQDEIDRKKEEILQDIEGRLKQKINTAEIFTIRWKVA